MLVGERVKLIRKSQNLTINQLSNLSGISSTTISNIENGKYWPNAITLHNIARALKVDINDLWL